MAFNTQQFGSRNDNPPQRVNEEILNKSKLVAYARLRNIPPTLAPHFMRNPPCMSTP
ncbi:UNVERIFIED_CONTAM: hypothetical protein Sradi_0765400 [Sesamum radiatum]|uniref:Uncharacterized protein n=1 Tax=Sesamum radiatum TaxID=300843 RepID=A0AAW2VNR2_SESRA